MCKRCFILMILFSFSMYAADGIARVQRADEEKTDIREGTAGDAAEGAMYKTAASEGSIEGAVYKTAASEGSIEGAVYRKADARLLPFHAPLSWTKLEKDDEGDEYGGEDEGGDEYDDGFMYEINGPGDQYIQISLMPSFPLNFNGNMYVGGAAQLGYRRFILKWLLVGGDLMIGYHPTVGSNIFNFWPITLAVTFQPTLGKFEFPMSIGAGVAFETYRNNKYFPGFVLKPEACAFYRINESWSAGLGASFLWMPQWYNESKYNYDGFFLTASLSARYHF